MGTMRWCETAENQETNNDNDTGKINEDKKEGVSVIEMGESGWGSFPLSSATSCRPQLWTVISKTTVGSSLASRVYGKEGGAGVRQG